MPRCFLATKSRPPLKNVATAAAARRCNADADAAGQNNRSTIGSISAAQAVQSIQEPLMLHREPHRETKGLAVASAARLLPSVPLPVEALERPGGDAVTNSPTPPSQMVSDLSRHAMPLPPQPMSLVSAAPIHVKQEEDCEGECNVRDRFALLTSHSNLGASQGFSQC